MAKVPANPWTVFSKKGKGKKGAKKGKGGSKGNAWTAYVGNKR